MPESSAITNDDASLRDDRDGTCFSWRARWRNLQRATTPTSPARAPAPKFAAKGTPNPRPAAATPAAAGSPAADPNVAATPANKGFRATA